METIDLGTPTAKCQKVTDKLTEKSGNFRQKYGNFKIKTKIAYGSQWRCFRENGWCKFETNGPLLKNIARKKINDILFETELSDYKQ